MALELKLHCVTVATTLLLLLLYQVHVRANSPALGDGGGGEKGFDVVTVHVLEKYLPVATAYQIGTYGYQVGWRLVLSFKASSLSSREGISCFETVTTSSSSHGSTSRDQAEPQVLRRVINRSSEKKNAFCVSERDDVLATGPNIISYSENSTTFTSLVRASASIPEIALTSLLFRFEALKVRQWQQFEDLQLVTDMAVQRIKSPRFGLCDTYLKVQWENFNFNYTDSPALHLCVRTVTRSAHEFWTKDDQESYITNVQVIELDYQHDFAKVCSADYKPAVFDFLDVEAKDKIARLDLSLERWYAICYATSPLIVDGNPVPSAAFLKNIRFDQTANKPDRIVVEYNTENLALWQDSKLTDNQVNAW